MTHERVPLQAALPVGDLAWRSIHGVGDAASSLLGVPTTDPDAARVAVAYASERHFRLDGETQTAFAPLSGFFPTADGWVRTHANYPHHAEALRHALALPRADREEAAHCIARMSTDDIVRACAGTGALGVPVLPEDPQRDALLRASPVVTVDRLGDSSVRARSVTDPGAPLAGIRVLDLTRVIAGPVCSRTLALLGADVLRVDSPHLPEIEWQHLDTGHGKRSALLDLAVDTDRARFVALAAEADIVALGYRPSGLAGLGITPSALARIRPGVIVLQLTAWGTNDERGFDSLVQAASGIAQIESLDGRTPGALPAQALDHSAGYLLASSAIRLLARRQETGGSWLARTSLRRIAAELLAGKRTQPRHPVVDVDTTPHLQTMRVDGMSVTTARPAVMWEAAPDAFAPPRRWGQDSPDWLPR